MKKRMVKTAVVLGMALLVAGCGAQKGAAGGNTGTGVESKAGETKTEADKTAGGETAAAANEGQSDTSWPEKPVTFVVAASAGGDTDITARLAAKYLEKELGQTIVIQNIGDSSGTVASKTVKDSEPDGYTFLCYHPGILLNTIFGLTSYSYEDFEIAGPIAKDYGTCWAVSADAPYDDVKGLVEYSKDHDVTFATGIGAHSHATVLGMQALAPDLNVTIVDSGSAAEKVAAVLGGQLDVLFGQYGATKDYVTNGDFKVLGIFAEERNEMFPDVPTFKEQGYDLNFEKYYFLAAPKGTEEAIMSKMETALKNLSENAEYAKELETSLLSNPFYQERSAFTRFLGEETAFYTDLAASYE